ncbi:MAG: ComEC/Rec2 family competence protein [Candidatus Saccharibacteria bacterium]|nr:ComEC/Rec2 family competence protein [Candidatus Saccharibacteria bacterium]
MNWWALKRKMHISWLISIGCIGIFIGIYCAKYFTNSHISLTYYLLLSCILFSIVFWRKNIYIIPLLIFGALLFGLWRGSISQNELSQYKSLYKTLISVGGTVKDDVDAGTSNQIIVRLNTLTINSKKMPGTLYITTSGDDIKRGDKLILHGKLAEGFGNFPGVMYRATIDKIIHPKPGDAARVVRDWFADAIRRSIPEPESSLGIGYLVGQRRSLPVDLSEALKLAGLTHVIVASGYNLTILVRLARRLFIRVSKYASALAAVVMILVFMAIAGASPSMSRAGLIACLSLAAWYYGRKFHPIVLLSVAIAVTVLIEPSYAWGDLGWQLSFAAFAGVMILAPLSQRFFFGDKKPGTVAQILGETVSAQIVTAPIIIASFGQLSNVAIVSNLLVLPLVPLAMLFTFIAGLGSLLVPAIATFIAMPATWLLRYSVGVTEYLAGLPWVTSVVNLAWWGVGLCYLVIISICIYMWRVTKYNLRESNLVE